MSNILKINKKDSPLKINMKAEETVAELIMYGAIGESYWDEDEISAKSINKALKDLPSSVQTIEVRVNSAGGSVFDGVAIYERLKQHKAKVVAYVDGIAASIASIIIMAADEIIMGDGAQIMIHKPLAPVYGNSDELERMINILDKIEENMVSIYRKRMSESRIEISRMLSEETWFTSDGAIEAGLADRKMADNEGIFAAASMLKNADWIRKKPDFEAKKREELRKKITDIRKGFEGKLARN